MKHQKICNKWIFGIIFACDKIKTNTPNNLVVSKYFIKQFSQIFIHSLACQQASFQRPLK